MTVGPRYTSTQTAWGQLGRRKLMLAGLHLVMHAESKCAGLAQAEGKGDKIPHYEKIGAWEARHEN